MVGQEIGLPAICVELCLHAVEGVPLVNSRDVAAVFEKEHAIVLRAIRDLEIDAELHRSWFRGKLFKDSYGRDQPSFDLTRQGFTLLVMGFTGRKADAFKIKYIQAFDAMEAALRAGLQGSIDVFGAFQRIEQSQERLQFGQEEIFGELKEVRKDLAEVIPLRRWLLAEDEAIQIAVIEKYFHGLSPYDLKTKIVENGKLLPNAQQDHAFGKNNRKITEIWIISDKNNQELRNSEARMASWTNFYAFQRMIQVEISKRQREIKEWQRERAKLVEIRDDARIMTVAEYEDWVQSKLDL
jgi:Rha family phage regulatory protein